MPKFREVAPDEGQTAFMSDTVISLTLVLDELVAVLIDCIVCQMHEQVIHVVVVGWDVLISCKPRETFPVHINPERVHSTEEYVNAKVEF